MAMEASQAHQHMHSRGGQPKKQYINDTGDPSKVVHCRNVTADVTQSSLMAMCQQFGRVVNVVMLRAKNQALIEMDSLENAEKVVDYCHSNGYVDVDHRRVYVKYSRHQVLDDTPPGKTLLVSMFNPDYDISNAVQISPVIVYQIFANYGQVQKIVVLPKNASSEQNHNRVQSLVQFSDAQEAENVKGQLQGQPVTLGEQASFYLDIQFSKVPEITTQSGPNSMVVPKGSNPNMMAQQQQAGLGGAGQMGQMGQMGQLGQLGQMAQMGQAGQPSQQQPQQQPQQGLAQQLNTSGLGNLGQLTGGMGQMGMGAGNVGQMAGLNQFGAMGQMGQMAPGSQGSTAQLQNPQLGQVGNLVVPPMGQVGQMAGLSSAGQFSFGNTGF